MSNKKTDLNRRNLLKGIATAAAAGTVAAAVSGTANATSVTAETKVEKKAMDIVKLNTFVIITTAYNGAHNETD